MNFEYRYLNSCEFCKSFKLIDHRAEGICVERTKQTRKKDVCNFFSLNMMAEVCCWCKFSEAHNGEEYLCKRRAPVYEPGWRAEGKFPGTKASSYCGDFERRDVIQCEDKRFRDDGGDE